MTDADGDDGKDNSLEFDSSLFQSLNLEDIEEIIKQDKVGNFCNNNCSGAILTGQAPAPLIGMEGVAGPSRRGEPYTKILIQPAQKALRFRYECEGRSAGSIPGANSTPENKTFPTIQVVNYVGRAVVVVSCVTKDPPYRPHPHKLVGKEGCKKGICTVSLNNDNMICSFSNLGIQCVKRKDIEEALREREEDRVDPFGTTFAHKSQTGNIDLNSVRLCFQVFIEDKHKRTFTIPLQPVVSDPIFDKKAMCDLVICKLSACSASVLGQSEIIILCEKIVRDDIQVRFYEQKDGQLVWEGFGDFQPSDVHKQVAISLKTPRYHDTDLQHPIDVYIQLRRPSDGTISESRAFQFLPVDSDHEAVNKKRRKVANASLDLYLAENTESSRRELNPMSQMLMDPMGRPMMNHRIPIPRPIRQAHKPRIKAEPPDTGYACGGAGQYPMQGSPMQHHMHQGDLQPGSPFYPMQPHQVPSPMDTTPSAAGGYNPAPSTSSGGSHRVIYGLGHMSQQGFGHSSSPEVITVPSYSSAGSSSIHSEAVDHQQQAISSGSTQLSLGLGSLDSIALSEVTLSILGSHLSDTFLCLNDNLGGQLAGQPDFAAGGPMGNDGGQGQMGAMEEQQRHMSREQSSDSFSCIQHVQDQIRELNQLSEVSAAAHGNTAHSMSKFK